MNTDRWLIALALLLLIGLGGVCWKQTQITEQERQLAAAWARNDEAIACAYWLRIRDRPAPWVSPVDPLYVSSGVGYRTDPMGGSEGERLHKGVDIPGKIGTPIRAPRPGVVVEHWLVPGRVVAGVTYRGHPVYGGLIVLSHGDGLYSLYGHLSRTDVHTGQWVEAGQVIGALGDTGIATGPHLHWEIVVDPLKYLETK